ncbi:MAG: glycosyl transferase family 2 [Gammaproteobacteria bacterium]|nr:MAG: glycosyl transferase family 2 [Gammaproteobacteria bacterium]TND07328.1 MAG: glycosyl transferase, family 2 [Gammaproteobacteria bacterium]
MPDISLIVSTTGREKELARLLNSLLSEETSRFEIILVDQSKDEQIREKLAHLVTEFSDQLRITHVVDEGRGLSRARNIGLKIARGKITGFPDDDCWYSGRVVAAVWTYFKAHPQTTILAGPYSEPGVINPAFPSRPLALTLHNFIGKTSSVGLFINTESPLKPVIYFDERIGAGTAMPIGEETDLVMRLLCQGALARFEPDIVVYHQIQRDKALSPDTYAAMTRAFWYVIAKNYKPLWTEARVLRGVAGCLFRPQRFGCVGALRALFDGCSDGLKERRHTSSERKIG